MSRAGGAVASERRYVIALDQGTTSSRALLVDRQGAIVGRAQQAFPQHFPQPGWVEHDPRDIASSQLAALTELLVSCDVKADQVECLAISNQRETTLVWDRKTGQPLCNAIVWQCRRTAPLIERLKADEATVEMIVSKTGLVPDPYFSASKIAWILDEVPGAREKADRGELAFGTVDSWLLWVLTGGAVHATDMTNASRTMLFNIHALDWDEDLLALFDIPRSLMPEVRPSAGDFGMTANDGVLPNVPIRSAVGDQQAALFGQGCWNAGEAKSSYGTGGFLLMHTGAQACTSHHGLLTTIAAQAPGTQEPEYALEGSVFMAGALVQWLRDGMGLVDDVADTERIALSVPDAAGIHVVPAFTGLGAPYWDPDARGAILGLTRGATSAHVVRASLESIAFQINDLALAMMEDAAMELALLRVDGGASRNGFLMQFQADMLGCPLMRSEDAEATALGAAYLAGLSTGFWEDREQVRAMIGQGDRFEPSKDAAWRAQQLRDWREAVGRTRTN